MPLVMFLFNCFDSRSVGGLSAPSLCHGLLICCFTAASMPDFTSDSWTSTSRWLVSLAVSSLRSFFGFIASPGELEFMRSHVVGLALGQATDRLVAMGDRRRSVGSAVLVSCAQPLRSIKLIAAIGLFVCFRYLKERFKGREELLFSRKNEIAQVLV